MMKPPSEPVPAANATYDQSVLQIYVRDLAMGSHRAMVDEDTACETFGRVLLGLPPGSTIL